MEEGAIQPPRNWPPGNAPGRLANALWQPVASAYKRHAYRYGAWDQGSYRIRVRIIAAVGAVAMLAAAGWFARAAYLRHEDFAEVAEARNFLAQGDFRLAAAHASRALRLNPTDAEACRILAKTAAAAHSSDEYNWLHRAAELAPTLENKLALAEAGLRWQDPPFRLSTTILAALSGCGPTNAAYDEISAKLEAFYNHAEAAESYFAAASRLAPANPEYALNLAVFRLKHAGNADKPAARRQVEKFVADAGLRLTALRALAADTLAAGDLPAARGYSQSLMAAGQPTLSDRLQSLEILQRLDAKSVAAGLAEVEKAAETNPADVVAVSDWMRSHGLLQENMEWLNEFPPGAHDRPPVAEALAMAYLDAGQWQEVLAVASRGDWEEADFLRLAMISRAWSKLGMAPLAESNWGEAIRKAGDRFEAVTNLLALAQAWQLKSDELELSRRVKQFTR